MHTLVKTTKNHISPFHRSLNHPKSSQDFTGPMTGKFCWWDPDRSLWFAPSTVERGPVRLATTQRKPPQTGNPMSGINFYPLFGVFFSMIFSSDLCCKGGVCVWGGVLWGFSWFQYGFTRFPQKYTVPSYPLFLNPLFSGSLYTIICYLRLAFETPYPHFLDISWSKKYFHKGLIMAQIAPRW